MKKLFKNQSPEEQAKTIEFNKVIYDEYFDKNYMQLLVNKFIKLIDEAYFRSRFIDFDDLEERKENEPPTIFYSNHSGMAFPWDGMVMCARLYQMNQFKLNKFLRPLAAPALSLSNLMNPYMIKHIWKRVGAVDATFLNFETMMQYPDSHLMLYPEGVPGIGKGFNKKYQTQRFATSFIRLACKYKAPICPIHTVNGEFINPYTYSFESINKLVRKIGVPFLPIGLLLPFMLIFPWLFYYAWPARLTYIKGKVFKPWELIDKQPEDITEEDIDTITKMVQNEFQKGLTENVKTYGQRGIQWKHFWKTMILKQHMYPLNMPFGWPAFFAEFERKFIEGKGEHFNMEIGWAAWFKYLLRNPFFFFFYIPILGWIPLAIRGFKRTIPK